MRPTPANHNIEWLLESSEAAPSAVTIGAGTQTRSVQVPYPGHLAKGVSHHTQTRDGIVLIQDEHHFTHENCPPTIQLGKFSVAFPEPVFAIHTVHKGKVLLKEPKSNEQLVRQPGTDSFAHYEEFVIEQSVMTSQSILTTGLIIPVSQLIQLLDEEFVGMLFERLNISTINTYGLFQIPPSISKMLENCVDHSMRDTLKELQLQARVLDYLCSLALHLDAVIVPTYNQTPSKVRARAIHNFLISAGAETPTLTSLSQKFGASPNKLNTEFLEEYGESIFSFLTNHRLEQARLAIEKSQQPLKVIAHKIGYSHVNHFITAFKRKYSCTPGSLRP